MISVGSGSVSSSVSLRLLAVVLLGAFATMVDAELEGQSKGTVNDPLDPLYWLAQSGVGENVAKSRARRFVPFPDGSTIELETELTIPIDSIGRSSDLEITTTFQFNLPTVSSFARSYQSRRGDRINVYAKMEEFLADLGYNGHACTLRTLCEIAETPFEHGLYGEIINLILSASVEPEENTVYDEYMTAEYYGKHYGNCGAIYSNCRASVLDIISNAF